MTDRTPFDEQLDRIETALGRPSRRLRLDAGLEREYHDKTAPGRTRTIRLWHAIALAVILAALALDHVAGVLVPGLVLRLGIVTPLYLLAFVFLDRGPQWLRTASVVVPFFAIVASMTVLGRLAPDPHSDRYLMAACLLVLFANAAVPFRFSHAVAATVASLAALVLLSLVMATPDGDQAALLAFIVGASLMSLFVRFRAERASRNSFLTRRRDELKSAELVALTEQLTELAETDPMTGLYNRRHLVETLKRKWREASEQRDWIGVLMIDIDRFKAFNDAAGHDEGDRCLKAVAGRLEREVAASEQYLARYGGEEFMAVLSELEPDPLIETAERLRRAIEEMGLPHPGLGGAVTVSIGASDIVPSSASSVEDLIVAADRALYAAKAAGRNRVEAAAVVGRRNGEAEAGDAAAAGARADLRSA